MDIIVCNEAELEKHLKKINKIVVREVSSKAVDLLKSMIYKYTYWYGKKKNKLYVRDLNYGVEEATNIQEGVPTYEFLEAWRKKGLEEKALETMEEIFYDYTTMRVDPDRAIHSEGGDARKMLAEAFNIDGFFAKYERKPYWDIFIEELSNKIWIWFKEEYRKLGIEVK